MRPLLLAALATPLGTIAPDGDSATFDAGAVINVTVSPGGGVGPRVCAPREPTLAMRLGHRSALSGLVERAPPCPDRR